MDCSIICIYSLIIQRFGRRPFLKKKIKLKFIQHYCHCLPTIHKSQKVELYCTMCKVYHSTDIELCIYITFKINQLIENEKFGPLQFAGQYT